MIGGGRGAPQGRPGGPSVAVAGPEPSAGYSLIEALIGAAIIALVLTLSFAVVTGAALHEHRVEDERHAMDAIEAELERACATPFDALLPRTSEPLDGPATREVLAGLEEAEASLTVAETDVPGLRRVRVAVAWGRGGRRTRVGEVLVARGGR